MSNPLQAFINPECAVRPERFETESEARTCATKNAALVAGILVTVTIVCVTLFVLVTRETPPGIWVVLFGGLAFAVLQLVAAGPFAARTWQANNAKIMQVMKNNPALKRGEAVDTVVRENMQQAQLDVASRAAAAQERTSNALMVNTGLNLVNSFKSN